MKLDEPEPVSKADFFGISLRNPIPSQSVGQSNQWTVAESQWSPPVAVKALPSFRMAPPFPGYTSAIGRSFMTIWCKHFAMPKSRFTCKP